jgi:hypothetical protein
VCSNRINAAAKGRCAGSARRAEYLLAMDGERSVTRRIEPNPILEETYLNVALGCSSASRFRRLASLLRACANGQSWRCFFGNLLAVW